MANEIELKKERIVSLLNRDFASIKRSLITFAQAYASGSFSDFNEASPGMALLELMAATADMNSFYIDQAFNEMRDSTSRQLENIQSFAKMRGYRPSGPRCARGLLDFAIEVPGTTNGFGEVVPDESYTPSLLKGSQATADNGSIYETLEDLYFSSSLGRQVTGSRFDASTGLPTHFALRKAVEVVAGQTVTETFSVTAFKQFRQLELAQSNVIEVIDVFDDQGNEWIEVNHLAQDWVFSDDTNSNVDVDSVPYVLKVRTVPRRFIVDRDIVTGKSSLVFGSGDGNSFDDDYVPNIADYSLPLAGRRTYSSYSIDPQNFLKTRSFGLSPHDTTLTVRYRYGGGQQTNVPERSIRQVSKASLSFSTSNLNTSVKGQVEGSVGCINLSKMAGGGPEESAREIKLNASAFFAAQDRAVTKEDIAARVMAMPQKFGKPEKVFVRTTPGSRFSYDIHILSRDQDGTLVVATDTLKSNVATYISKYRMLTDNVNILDTKIIDVRVEFSVSVSSRFNRSEVVAVCINKLSDYFAVGQMQIGAPVILSDVISYLQETPGVIAVADVRMKNVFGIDSSLSYSDVRFDVDGARRDGMIVCPSAAIFNVRYPRKDIVGGAK